jgi:hydroxypyruvate isomerase
MRFALNLSLFLADTPVDERPGVAALLGFRSVETWWPFDEPRPPDADLQSRARPFLDAGTSVVAMNFFAGDMAAGDRGIVSHPDRRDDFRRCVEAALSFAEMVGGCGVFNALYGNRLEGVSDDDQAETALDNLRYACEAAASVGSHVVVEAVNSHENPHYPITSTRAAISLLDEVADGQEHGPRYLYDCYHMQRMEGDLISTIRQHVGRFGHVQIADAPGRNQPGSGEINFKNVLAELDRAGYQGVVGLEYRPLGDPAASLAWLDDGVTYEGQVSK